MFLSAQSWALGSEIWVLCQAGPSCMEQSHGQGCDLTRQGGGRGWHLVLCCTKVNILGLGAGLSFLICRMGKVATIPRGAWW